MKTQHVLYLITIIAAVAGGWFAGKQFGGESADTTAPVTTNAPSPTEEPQTIHGLGSLQPASGVIKIVAAPGQRVEKLNVSELGEPVKKGQVLAVLQTLELRELELAMAQAKQAEARSNFDFEKRLSEFKLKSALLAVQDAEATLASVDAKSKSSELIEKQIKLAQESLDRLTSLKKNPATSQLVNQSDIDQQKLMVQRFNMQLDEAKVEIDVANSRGHLARELAANNLETAQFIAEKADAKYPAASMEQAIELAKLAVDSATIKSPIDGVVLDIIVKPGDAVSNRPILIVGDTGRIICEAEINDSQMKFVKEGQVVKLTSKALSDTLSGFVSEVGVMIGPPSLSDPNPYASVDRKTGRVLIQLDDASSKLARDLVNLQVEVEISLTPKMNED